MTSEHSCLYQLVESQAHRTSDAFAIVSPGRKGLTYSRLLKQIDVTVRTLNAAGFGRNDRVAVVLPYGPEMAVASLAIAAGATCAPLNPAYESNEFEFYLSDLNARALVVQSGMDSPAIAVAQRLGIAVIQLSPVLEAEAGVFKLAVERGAGLKDHCFAQPLDIAITLHTSGTTSRPKLVPLTQANFCAAAYQSVAAFALSSSDRCFNVMPLFHIHALMVIVASVAAGASILYDPDQDLNNFFKNVQEFHPSWYTASPTLHQAILAQAKWNRETIARVPFRFIRSSSSRLPPKIMAELEDVFRAPVIESYAMTEASYLITSNPLPPGKRKVGSVGVAAGPEVGVMDSGKLLPSGEMGEIVIRGPNVTQGYENNPSANASSFSDGWLRTGDLGYLDAEGYLFLTGRLKEIINRGGEKISPYEVDEVVMQHPAVSQVATFAVPHPTLGEDVAAAIVLRENLSATEDEIRQFTFHRLAYFKVPRRVVFLDALPKGPTGKVHRVGLADKLCMKECGLSPDYAPPRTPTQVALASIWARVLHLEEVGIRDSFFDLGGNSLLAVVVLTQITKTFGRNLPLWRLYQAETIEQLDNSLRETEKPTLPWSNLVPIQPSGSKPPFFWVHGERSNAFLPRYLGPDQPLYGFAHQSEDGRPASHTSVVTIAAHYLSEMRTVQPVGPYLLGGFSFGGTIAFEVAQQLRRQGEEVSLLFLLDSQFPGPESEERDTTMDSLDAGLNRHLHNIARLRFGEKLDYILVRLVGKVNEKTSPLRKAARKLACRVYLAIGRPLPVFLRSTYILNIYFRARREYTPQPYAGGLVYIKSAERHGDHVLSWRRTIVGELTVYNVPGNHLDLVKESNGVWAGHLKNCLETAKTRAAAASGVPQKNLS